MHRQRIITFLLALLIAQIAASQDVLNGIVLDKETQEPIVGATVSDGSKGKPLAVTAADGRFRLPKNNYAKLKISYIGYKTLITVPSKDGRYLLQAEISRIGEVVVTVPERSLGHTVYHARLHQQRRRHAQHLYRRNTECGGGAGHPLCRVWRPDQRTY